MKQKYGKLTIDQLREFTQTLPDVFAMLRGANEHIARTPSAKFDSVMSGDYGVYAWVYELPFVQHLTLVAVALNRHEDVNDMAAPPDPQEALLELLRRRDEVDDDRPIHDLGSNQGPTD